MRKMLFLSPLLLGLSALPALAAAQHTVPWYLANSSARAATLSACNADPGDLAKTPDCINASAAESDFITAML